MKKKRLKLSILKPRKLIGKIKELTGGEGVRERERERERVTTDE